MVLVTFQGYIRVHVIRTGDFDALLTLFMTLYLLFLYRYLKKPNPAYLSWFFVFLIFAVFTKGIAGLLFIPGIILYVGMTKSGHRFQNRRTYLGLLFFVALVGGYYMLRNIYNPGYLATIWENELGGRFGKTTEGHKEGFWFYWLNEGFYYWIFAFIPAIFVSIFHSNKDIKLFSRFSFLMVLIYLVIITVSKTKLDWYLAPIYPLLALILAVFIYTLLMKASAITVIKNDIAKLALIIIMLFSIFVHPYAMVLRKLSTPTAGAMPDVFFQAAYYLKNVNKEEIDLNGYKMLRKGYSPNIDFYMIKLQEQGVNVQYGHSNELNIGDKLLLWQKKLIDELLDNYDLDTIKIDESMHLLEVKGRK